MMRKIITALILVPLAIAFVLFAVANRERVLVSFDPFDPSNPAFAVPLPLFALILILLIGGVLLGGIAAWLKQAKWRRAARSAEAEVRRLRAELAHLRRQSRAGEPAMPAGQERPRLTIPPPAA
jgi:uncharacterized integral membrane protein